MASPVLLGAVCASGRAQVALPQNSYCSLASAKPMLADNATFKANLR